MHRYIETSRNHLATVIDKPFRPGALLMPPIEQAGFPASAEVVDSEPAQRFRDADHDVFYGEAVMLVGRFSFHPARSCRTDTGGFGRGVLRRLSKSAARAALGWALLVSCMAGASTASAQDPFGMLEAYGAMSAQSQYASSLHAQYSSGSYDDDGPRSAPSPALSPEELAVLEADALKVREQKAAEFERWQNGFWEFFQSRDPAEPGQFCAAMFQSPGGMITLTGLDDSWDGALLMFTGENVPNPRRFREITATLTQTGDPAATLRVFNYANDPRMNRLGTLVFAVPSMRAALDGMTDQQEFAVSVNGREVFRMGWKDGLSAVQGMRRCLDQG